MTTTTNTLSEALRRCVGWVDAYGEPETKSLVHAALADYEAQAEAKPAPAEPVAWYVIRVAPGKRDDGRRVGLWWKREQAEEWVDEHHVLRPLVDAAPAEPAPANIRERWNIERDGDDLLVCFNNHDKGEKCEYERFVRAPAAPAHVPEADFGNITKDAERYRALRATMNPTARRSVLMPTVSVPFRPDVTYSKPEALDAAIDAAIAASKGEQA